RKGRSLPQALKYFFTYGFATSLWEIFTYLQRTAINVDDALIFFQLSFILSMLGQSAYLAAILSIYRRPRRLMLIFLPAILAACITPLNSSNLRLTPYGWLYIPNRSSLISIIEITIYTGYLAAAVFFLADLILRARSKELRIKYGILLGGLLVFQYPGLILTNYLFTTSLMFPPLDGILFFATLLSVSCALIIREKEIPTMSSHRDFSAIYSSFLAILYNMTGKTKLGEESSKFIDFIKESGIKDYVRISNRGIRFSMPSSMNYKDLISRNLKILEDKFGDSEIVDCYLRVLNAAYHILSDKFYEIIKENESFLKKSDLIYGVANGCFLREIKRDDSLNLYDPIKACFKIYKRLLLPIDVRILSSSDSEKRLAMHYATRNVIITEYGEILMQKAERDIRNLPKNEQLSTIIDGFNSFVSWIYEKALSRSEETHKILDTLQRILDLNKKVAVKFDIYGRFLETLASKIPERKVRQLYLDYLEEESKSRIFKTLPQSLLVICESKWIKRIQKQLIESERMAAIGEVATMISHDTRNPLQVIFNTLYLAMKKIEELRIPVKEKKSLKRLLKRIYDQADYINGMITNLQEYVREAAPELIETDLHDLIEDVISSIDIPKNIRVVLDIKKSLSKMLVDPVMMKRVFINLIKNAIEAMPEGGEIKISMSIENNHALITFEDTGIGIPEDKIKEIFRPFFTTKSKGLGLGLAICKKLIEAHGGSISVRSKVGEGSRFEIKLPFRKSKEDLLA
ncbi:GHKL domain-containing protein, partial [Candidatus Bathyarchaeota archaeon]|nr:GHKL domain-containing protein [Candidatus Bathyarchaeota archaeon]